MKESLNFCIPGMHPIEIHYTLSFIYTDSIYAIISRNLTLAYNKGILYMSIIPKLVKISGIGLCYMRKYGQMNMIKLNIFNFSRFKLFLHITYNFSDLKVMNLNVKVPLFKIFLSLVFKSSEPPRNLRYGF
jgi:hypothetical protein